MASGVSEYKYQTDKGSIFKCRMDNDAVLDNIRGTAPTGTTTENMTVKISKNNKEAGISPRYVIFARQIGTTGGGGDGGTACILNTGKRYKNVICLTPTAFDAVVTGAIGGAGVTTFTQNGANYYAASKHGEDVN